MKENLKPVASKQSKPDGLRTRVTACLLQNEPASYADRRVKGPEARSRRETKSEEGVARKSASVCVDPKPGDLPMARLQAG